jgi:streptogramin lyase
VPTVASQPFEITAGPDGNLWFTELAGNKIGRIDPGTGSITEFSVPTPSSGPNTIRRGPDPNPATDCSFQLETLGAAGFAARYGTFGGCVATLGTTKTLLFTEQNANRIAHITTDVTIFVFPIPTPISQPIGITVGSDSGVWFAESGGNKIGRLDVRSVGEPVAPGRGASGDAADPFEADSTPTLGHPAQ